jgi:hypothetical protein
MADRLGRLITISRTTWQLIAIFPNRLGRLIAINRAT